MQDDKKTNFILAIPFSGEVSIKVQREAAKTNVFILTGSYSLRGSWATWESPGGKNWW